MMSEWEMIMKPCETYLQAIASPSSHPWAEENTRALLLLAMQCYHIVSRLDHVHFLPKKSKKDIPHGNETWLHVAGNSQTWMFQRANHETKNELRGNFHCHVWIVMKHTDTSRIECFYIQNLTLITHPNHPDISRSYKTLSSWTMSRTWSVALPWLSPTLWQSQSLCPGTTQWKLVRPENDAPFSLVRSHTFVASNVTVLWCIVCRTS